MSQSTERKEAAQKLGFPILMLALMGYLWHLGSVTTPIFAGFEVGLGGGFVSNVFLYLSRSDMSRKRVFRAIALGTSPFAALLTIAVSPLFCVGYRAGYPIAFFSCQRSTGADAYRQGGVLSDAVAVRAAARTGPPSTS
jgi:hypothetical protein